MPTLSLFGRVIEAAAGWVDGTTYTFYIGDDGAAASNSNTAPGLLRAGLTQAGDAFRPNVTVTRASLGDRTLAAYVAEARQSLQARLPMAKVLREDDQATLGNAEARESELQIVLDRPLPQLWQWHAWTAREGHTYHFCATATLADRAEHTPAFRAFVAACVS